LAWMISFDSDVERDLKKLDKNTQKKVIDYLKKRIAKSENPRKHGKPLKGKLSGIWRYRLGDYRILCKIREQEALILVLRIGHRKNIYL